MANEDDVFDDRRWQPPVMEKRKLGVFPYVMGAMSFIPIIGLFFAVPVIVFGLIKIRRGGLWLVLLSIIGAASGIFLVGSVYNNIFHKVQKSGLLDTVGRLAAQENLNILVKDIEFYKIQHGEYPPDLDVLTIIPEKGKSATLTDMSIIVDTSQSLGFESLMSTPAKARPHFYYRLIDQDHYYLLGVGPDGVPFTPDDVVPALSTKNIGLVIKDQSRPVPQSSSEVK